MKSSATPLWYTNEEKTWARLGGFKKKKPKKPKSKTNQSIINYITGRYNPWVKELKEKAKEGKKRAQLIENLRKCK